MKCLLTNHERWGKGEKITIWFCGGGIEGKIEKVYSISPSATIFGTQMSHKSRNTCI